MNTSPKVTIGVVLYKGEKYLGQSMTSLIDQDYENCEFLLRDQSPNGEAYEYIKKELPEVFEKVRIEKGDNRWHSGGHNALIQQMSGDYYVCASNDILYPPDFIRKMVTELEKPENKKFGSATCKLRIWDFNPSTGSGLKTDVLDSCGLGIKANHHFYDRGQGEKDSGQYDDQREIFGPSGALGIYRKKALDDIAFKGEKGIEFFDKLIHHKNDIDLAYRLQWSGWPSLYLPNVTVYHDRQAKNINQSPSLLVRIVKSRKGKSKWVKEDSFFGQQFVLFKNYSRRFSLKTKLKTHLHQWLVLGYTGFFEPNLMKVFKDLKYHTPEINRKRKAIKIKIKPEQIEKLMT